MLLAQPDYSPMGRRRGGLAALADPLEALAVGAAGTGVYSGYKVAHVETFNGALASDLVRPGNPYGKFANNFSERDRRKTSTTSVGTMADQYWTGDRDAGDGVPITSFSDVLSAGGGVLTMKCRRATSGEIALMGARSAASGPATTERRMTWAHPTLLAAFAVHGPRITETRWRFTCPFSPNSSPANPAMARWWLNVRGGSEQGSTVGVGEINDEFDEIEDHISGGQINNRYAFNQNDFTTQAADRGAWRTTRCTYSAASIVVEKLNDAGTVLETDTVINSTKNLGELFYLMFGVFNVTTAGLAFDDAAWIGLSQTLEVGSVRVWTPSAAATLAPLVADGTPISMALGATTTLTLPSQATLWGGAVDGEYLAWQHATDTNGPGRTSDFVSIMETRDNLPVGVTYDAPSRTITFGSGFASQAGVIVLLVYPYTSTSGVSRPYRVAVYVKPKVALPALPAVTAGAPFSTIIPRVNGSSVRYWDNGNCPNGSGHGLTMVSAPAWLSFDAATRTLSGTAPGGFTSDTITWRCTNGAGLYTEQTQPIATTVITPVNEIAGYVYAWDTTDTSATPDDGSGKAQFLKDAFDPTKSIGRTSSSGRPTISTTGGPAGNKRVLVFTTASSAMLRSTEGANSATITALGNNADIKAAASVIYLCLAVKADATGIQRICGWHRNDNYFQVRNGTSDRGISHQATTAAAGSVVQASQDTNWHVIEVAKNGASVTVWVDGVSVATGTISTTGALSTTDFVIGANYVSSTLTPALNGQIGPGWMGSAIPGSSDQAAIKAWVANKMGITVA